MTAVTDMTDHELMVRAMVADLMASYIADPDGQTNALFHEIDRRFGEGASDRSADWFTGFHYSSEEILLFAVQHPLALKMLFTGALDADNRDEVFPRNEVDPDSDPEAQEIAISYLVQGLLSNTEDDWELDAARDALIGRYGEDAPVRLWEFNGREIPSAEHIVRAACHWDEVRAALRPLCGTFVSQGLDEEPSERDGELNFDEIARLLREVHGIDNAEVYMSGGGCATLRGGPTWTEQNEFDGKVYDDVFYAVQCGLGAYRDRPGQHSVVWAGDFAYGRDESRIAGEGECLWAHPMSEAHAAEILAQYIDSQREFVAGLNAAERGLPQGLIAHADVDIDLLRSTIPNGVCPKCGAPLTDEGCPVEIGHDYDEED